MISATTLLQAITQTLFLLVFIRVAAAAVRRPRRVTVDIALFFAALALIVASQWTMSLLHLAPSRLRDGFNGAVAMALPYLLLRLVEDFSFVPKWLSYCAAAGLVLSVVVVFVLQPLPPVATGLLVIYFFIVMAYDARVFLLEARRTAGVTRRRMQAVAAGTVFLSLVILVPLFRLVVPAWEDLWTLLNNVLGLASALGYIAGFATPMVLRRAWREPALRAFLARTVTLARLPDLPQMLYEVEQSAAAATGAPHATIGLWQEAEGVLRYFTRANQEVVSAIDEPPDRFIGGKAFLTQRAIYSANAQNDDPQNAETYHTYGSTAVLAAPITAGDRRLGVLIAYAPRAPVFVEDDLELVQLLADQAAMIVESRSLLEGAARVQAREEVIRLRDDFLSAAAHDLKTPVTTILAQAQLIERRLQRNPAAPVELTSVQRLVSEARRMSALVTELLDVSRAEQGYLVGSREPVDLVALAQEVCQEVTSPRHQVQFEADQPTINGQYDRVRVRQLLSNLLENAVKYSPDGGAVEVHVWQADDMAHFSVTDHGIGIPADELAHVFDRFHRGSNVDDRRFSGMGLGLYVCRAIAEEHGGAISVASTLGQGTTFRVSLPTTTSALSPASPPDPATPPDPPMPSASAVASAAPSRQ